MKCKSFQSLGKRAISVLAVAMFSILLGTATAQAECTTVMNGGFYTAVCPIDSNRGFVYKWVNNQWHYQFYFDHMTTNCPMLFMYEYQLWTYQNRVTDTVYGYTRAGWQPLSLQNEALRLLWQLNHTLGSPTMSQTYVNNFVNTSSSVMAVIRSNYTPYTP
jgi:hypothetical protein